MGKARTVSGRWINWKSKITGKATKIRIFYSNVKAVLLYASESLTFTQRTVNRLQVFINKCLRKIVNVGLHWPDKINNSDLRTKTDQEPVLIQIGLDIHCEEMTAASPNKLYTVDTTRPQKKRATTEHQKGSGVRNVDRRIQVQLKADGNGCSR